VAVVVVDGDLVEQLDVNALVNPWNRNFVPRWLYRPGGVSKVLLHAAGQGPFDEVRAAGVMAVGQAVVTSPGRLPVDGIIHVAGINAAWRATPTSVSSSARNACAAALEREWRAIAMPIIGSGHGSMPLDSAVALIVTAVEPFTDRLDVRVVRYPPAGPSQV
jgi:O-acetyl-ADP-ribose deacetylase